MSRAITGALLFLLLGCGEGIDGPTSPNAIVTGDVVAIQDLVPADGGVTITVTTPGGKTEILLFPSLFTFPRPSEQTIALYGVVSRVEVGDLIRAGGKRTAAGVELESLVILRGRP